MRLILLLPLLLAWYSLGPARDIIVPPSKPLLSPDRERTVRLVEKGREFRYEITDLKARTTVALPAWYNPVFAMNWSPDSRSIYVVTHVARGQAAQVLHLEGGKWRSLVVHAPEKQDHEYSVVDWSIGPKSLELVCVVLMERHTQGPPIYEVTFDVDPATGAVSGVRKKKPLSQQEWISYKSRFEP